MKLLSFITLFTLMFVGCKKDDESEITPSNNLYLDVILKNNSFQFENTLQSDHPSRPWFTASYGYNKTEDELGNPVTTQVSLNTSMYYEGNAEGFYFQYVIVSKDRQFIDRFLNSQLEDKKFIAAQLKEKTFTSKDMSSNQISLTLKDGNKRVYWNYFNEDNDLDYTLTIKNIELVIHPDPVYKGKEMLKVYTQFNGKVRDMNDKSQIEEIKGEMISFFTFPDNHN